MLYTWNEYDIVNQHLKKKSWEIIFISLCLGVGDTPFKVKAFYGFCLCLERSHYPSPNSILCRYFYDRKCFNIY